MGTDAVPSLFMQHLKTLNPQKRREVGLWGWEGGHGSVSLGVPWVAA